MDYAINQIKETIASIDSQLVENDNSLRSLQDSVGQLQSLSLEVSNYVSEVLNSIKESPETDSLQVVVSSLLQLRDYISQKPGRVSNTVSSLAASQRTLIAWKQREEEVIQLIESHREKIDSIKEKIESGDDLKRSIGDRPEKLKDIREASSEILAEE